MSQHEVPGGPLSVNKRFQTLGAPSLSIIPGLGPKSINTVLDTI